MTHKPVAVLPWWEPRSGWLGVLQGAMVPLLPVALLLYLLSWMGASVQPMSESVLQLLLVHAVVLPWLRVWFVVIPARAAARTAAPLPLAAIAAAWPVSGAHLMHGWPYVVAAWPCYAWVVWLYLRARSMRSPSDRSDPGDGAILPWHMSESERVHESHARRQIRRIQCVGYTLVAMWWWVAGLPWWVRHPPA